MPHKLDSVELRRQVGARLHAISVGLPADALTRFTREVEQLAAELADRYRYTDDERDAAARREMENAWDEQLGLRSTGDTLGARRREDELA